MLVHWGSKFTRRLREHFAWISRRSSLQICCLIFSRSGWSTTGWFFDIYSLDRTASFKLRYCAVSLLNYAKLFIRVLVVIEGFRDVHINRVALWKCQGVNGFSLFETLFSAWGAYLGQEKKSQHAFVFKTKWQTLFEHTRTPWLGKERKLWHERKVNIPIIPISNQARCLPFNIRYVNS